jgi:protease-4
MGFSKLYHTILNAKFFIDLRQVDALSVLLEKFLTKDLREFSPKILSECEPLKISYRSAEYPGISGSTGGAGQPGGDDGKKNLVAIIPLRGTMIKYGTMCSYGADEIAAAIDEAAANKKVTGIVLDIDSGGGAVDAVAPLVDAIRRAKAARKPVVACCDLCASAAYWTACECNEIMAANSISSEFGSIGVMMSFPDYAKYYEKEGIKIHTIYSNLSTYKNAPFEAAKKGEYDSIKAEELDPLARKFQANVRTKRAGKLNEDIEGILSGKVFYAEDALKHGLIDSIGTLDRAVERVRELAAEANINQYIKDL